MAARRFTVTADQVGKATVLAYYLVLRDSHDKVIKFYEDISILGRTEGDGTMSITSTITEISEKLHLLVSDESVEFKYVDSVGSFHSGINILVTGIKRGVDEIPRRFSQFFYLYPREKNLFLMVDVLRFTDCLFHIENAPRALVSDLDKRLSGFVQEYYRLLTNSPAEVCKYYEESSLIGRPEEDGTMSVTSTVAGINEKIVSRMYHEAIVDTKSVDVVESPCGDGVHVLVIGLMIRKDRSRKTTKFCQYFFITRKPAKEDYIVLHDILRFTEGPSWLKKHAKQQQPPTLSNGHSIYIRGLSLTTTYSMLEEEFKKFGSIKLRGIEVGIGNSFGSIEFEVPEAVQKAIEASPIQIDGFSVTVLKKRSMVAVGSGSRNYNTDGRESGRGYSRGPEFDGNRNNYGVGGRASNRGGVIGNERNNTGGLAPDRNNSSRGGASNLGGGFGFERNNNGGGRVNPGTNGTRSRY